MCEEQNEKDIEVKEDASDPLKEAIRQAWEKHLETPEGQEAKKAMDEGIKQLGDTINLLIKAIKPVADLLQRIFDAFAEQKEKALARSSKRVRHLALHGRTERIRKKNWKRVWKEYIKGVRYAERLVGESK